MFVILYVLGTLSIIEQDPNFGAELRNPMWEDSIFAPLNIDVLYDPDIYWPRQMETAMQVFFMLALPFAIIIMILLGVPFSLTTARGGVASSVGISIIIGLFYYLSIGISMALGKGNFLPPFVAAHFSNTAFFIVALILIKKAPA